MCWRATGGKYFKWPLEVSGRSRATVVSGINYRSILSRMTCGSTEKPSVRSYNSLPCSLLFIVFVMMTSPPASSSSSDIGDFRWNESSIRLTSSSSTSSATTTTHAWHRLRHQPKWHSFKSRQALTRHVKRGSDRKLEQPEEEIPHLVDISASTALRFAQNSSSGTVDVPLPAPGAKSKPLSEDSENSSYDEKTSTRHRMRLKSTAIDGDFDSSAAVVIAECLVSTRNFIERYCSTDPPHYSPISPHPPPQHPHRGHSGSPAHARLLDCRFEFCNQVPMYYAVTEHQVESMDCDRTIEHLLQVDRNVSLVFRRFADDLSRLDCDDDYSIAWGCSDCKVAYKSWLCVTTIPFYKQNQLVRPCNSYAEAVEIACPYLSPHPESRYAGEPAFLSAPPHGPDYDDGEHTSTCHHRCDVGDDNNNNINRLFSSSINNDARKRPGAELTASERSARIDDGDRTLSIEEYNSPCTDFEKV